MCSLGFGGERSSSWAEDLVVRRVMAGCISKCHYLGKTNHWLLADGKDRDEQAGQKCELEMSPLNWIRNPDKSRADAQWRGEPQGAFTDRTVD
ncbi:hypothetical protein DBV33_07500 [Pseudomonas fluorescens]|nr:hypothetical protein DBV33_07500 [Pseudomonas fluorescens]